MDHLNQFKKEVLAMTAENTFAFIYAKIERREGSDGQITWRMMGGPPNMCYLHKFLDIKIKEEIGRHVAEEGSNS